MSELQVTQVQREIAECVRAACRKSAQDAYERALADGLCAEGAFEVAMDSIQSLDITALLRQGERNELNTARR